MATDAESTAAMTPLVRDATAASDKQLDEKDSVTLNILHQGQRHSFTFPATATVSDLSSHIASALSIPEENQKLLISPKPGLLKPPFAAPSPHSELLLSAISARKITLLGSTPTQVNALNQTIATNQARAPHNRTYTAVKPATPARSRGADNIATLSSSSTSYTFLELKPLAHLPRPERSLRFLERLRDDPGVRAAMRSHRWTVPLLTEMDPAAHTTHESRTLGLNRNAGAAIELRLRTDAYDGYRDYRTIRRTLAHELAHNVHSEHDAAFWRLCGEVEAEIERGDWTRGGRTVGHEEFYNPADDGGDAVADHGGWKGGEFVLGGGAGGEGAEGSRREMMARAAEERLKKQRQQRDGDGDGGKQPPE